MNSLQTLCAALRFVRAAVASSEARAGVRLCGVHIVSTPEKTVFTATDGMRVHRIDLMLVSFSGFEPPGVILPTSAVDEILNPKIPRRALPVPYSLGSRPSGQLVFSCPQKRIALAPVTGPYPDVDRALSVPPGAPGPVALNSRYLADVMLAFTAVMASDEKNSPVFVIPSGDRAPVTFRLPEYVRPAFPGIENPRAYVMPVRIPVPAPL